MNGQLYIFKGIYERHFSLKRYLETQRAFSKLDTNEFINKIVAELPKSPYYSTESSWYREDGENAYIPVEGLLTQEIDLFSMLYFGEKQTSYKAIIDSIAKAESNSSIKNIYFEINSGGGYSDGMYSVLDAISSSSKNTFAVVGDYCCSAAYGIASQCGKIIARNNGSLFGSIGVAATFSDWSGFNEKMGVKEITLTNDDSTDKRPDIATDSGKQVYKEWLNDDFEVFFEYISNGRSKNSSAFSAEAVKSLKGRVVPAKKAVALGLADSIEKNYIASVGIKSGSGENTSSAKKQFSEGEKMTLTELLSSDQDAKKEHDAVVASASAVASDQAVTAERTRMMNILTKGGVAMSATIADSLQSGKSFEQFAVAMLDVHSAKPSFAADMPPMSVISPQDEAQKAGIVSASEKELALISKL